jgi:hypothetical protein
LTRKHGISRATYFNWQAKYGGVSVSELKRMKGLHVAAPAQVSNWHEVSVPECPNWRRYWRMS